MTTYFQFAPATNQPFTFQPTLDGAQYTATVSWNLYRRGWYLNLYTTQGQRLLTIPVVASPVSYGIDLVEGYFTNSTLVYRDASSTFEVSP